MTSRWKQKASVILTVIAISGLCLGLIILIISSGMLAASSSSNSDDRIDSNSENIRRVLDGGDSITSNRLDDYDLDNKTATVTNEYLQEEYIRPIKFNNLSLHTIDLLYESKRNNTLEAFSENFPQNHRITGNFRNRSSRIWDPHPEYLIEAFGKRLHLILYQDAAFMPNQLEVTHAWWNRTEKHKGGEGDHDHSKLHGCFYKGQVFGEEKSAVSVSLCNGMRGHIRTTDGSFFIEPVENYTNEDSNILHKIRRESSKHKVVDDLQPKASGTNCPIENHSKGFNGGNIDNNEIGMNFLTNRTQQSHTRRKRNIYDENQYTLEVLIAADRKMQEFHGAEIKTYILTLMQIVSNIYADASIGNSINVAVVHIMLLEDDLSIQYIDKGVYASHLLKRFCSFMQRRTEHYDTAILLTREQICRNTTETKCDTLGLAELGTVCKRHSCSIVQDNGLPAAFTIAHELGHVLNMPHDDDKKCHNFRKSGKPMLNIMSSTMGDDIHPWSWSDCSRHYVTEFLEKDEIGCMRDTPQKPIPFRMKSLPGEIYSLNQQCELIHGSGSTHCDLNIKDEKECGRLWCFEINDEINCRSSNLPWADGTPCRDKKHWCQRGECVRRDMQALKPINGGWGQWTPYTPCSRTCGGGIQESQRECNNPVPASGGKYCPGNHKKYRSCNTQDCNIDEPDFREQQCSELNGNDFDIPGIDQYVKWVPKYGVSPKDECKLFCRVENSSNYFQLADKVRDGTTCSFDSFNKCVNGICRQAGCDNELNSAAKLDSCGVCQGNNKTCDVVEGYIYRSDIERMSKTDEQPFYFTVLRISKGSANIEIKQVGSPLNNYIVLRDDNGGFLLNGNNVINTFKKTFPYAGVSFEYSGSNSPMERVNTTYSRKIKRDVIVQILSLPKETTYGNEILLTYSYTTPKTVQPTIPNPHPHHGISYKEEIYQWKLPEWSPCDSLCQGMKHRTPVCVKVDASLQVSSDHCDSSAKPSGRVYDRCNVDCELIRNITTVSKCSASCGMLGRRSIKYNCIKRYLANDTSILVDHAYCQRSASDVEYEDCTGSCAIWTYSEWSQCTRSCGTGQQKKSLICLSHPNGSEVDKSECSHLREPNDSLIQTCNTDECPAWVYGERTPCSVTCGIGQRTTAIYCMQNNQIVDKHMCASYPMLKPINTNCTMPPCQEQIRKYHINPKFRQQNNISNRIDDIPNSWRTGKWGDCEHNCFKSRKVHCYDTNPYNCPAKLKPSESERCCAFKYIASWTPCSVICGNGIRRRAFECHRVYKPQKPGERPLREKVDESYCRELGLRKRIPKRPQKSCKKTCKWEPGKWAPCSDKCSGEFTTRTVHCKTRKGRTIPNEYCDINNKPQQRQKCPCRRESNCSCLGWKRVTTPCTSQSRVCRNGWVTRRERCKPPEYCPLSCLDVKKIRNENRDGEYILFIRNKHVHIYCHNMNTSSPEEYLTLREGIQENFSLYYSKRSKDTSICPTRIRDNEFQDETIPHGRTQFSKIRIDISTLEVKQNDYTFARSHGKPQPFGTAGDCYNTNGRCPQGYFSINLKNTGFRLREKTRWDSYGDHTSIIYAQKLAYPFTAVSAHCGGYCGSCFVSKSTRLILETT